MPRSKLRTRFVAPAAGAVFALLAIATFGGCFVSFDGYQLGDLDAGAAGLGVSGHSGAGSAGRAGNTSAGAADGGNTGAAGASSAGAAQGGTSGAAQGGSAGAAQGGTSGAPQAGAGGSGGSTPQLVCPDPHNRITVEIPLPGGGFYCIDRAEVKNSEYKAFMDAASPPTGQAAACAFNTSYEPATTSGCNQFDPVNKKNSPIACVDWCDAAAFCKWDGKQLCGKIGGGSNPPASFADATQSQWFRACSRAGDFDFPYGNSYSGSDCVGVDNTAINPVAVPNTNCEGGYSGLYDMSGNVAEWEDSCTGTSGGTDQCLSRGGSYLDANQPVAGNPSLLCNSNVHGSPSASTKARSTRDKEIGFRCCSEPVAAP